MTCSLLFSLNAPAPTQIYTLSLHDALPIWPFTACHELAHQAGIGFEDEANYIGFVLARQSDDALFRYSAYYATVWMRSEEHTSELQSRPHLVCRLLLEKKKKTTNVHNHHSA